MVWIDRYLYVDILNMTVGLYVMDHIYKPTYIREQHVYMYVYYPLWENSRSTFKWYLLKFGQQRLLTFTYLHIINIYARMKKNTNWKQSYARGVVSFLGRHPVEWAVSPGVATIYLDQTTKTIKKNCQISPWIDDAWSTEMKVFQGEG